MAVEKQEIVTKSNRLVEASYRLTLVEQQLVLYAICRSREEQRGLSANEPVTIDARAFAEQFRVDAANVYRQLKEASDSLYERRVVIHDIHPKTQKPRTVKTRWVSDVAYIDGAGLVEITFAPKMIPFITRLEAEFTSYRLEKIGHMTSVHAVRLYELLVQYASVGMREMELAWLKEKLGIAGEYKAIKDFKKRVLDVALAQINEHSDIVVSHAQRKTGRTVTHLIFDIKNKTEMASRKPAKKAKQPVVDDAYIKKHARPGESTYQAWQRLLEEAGQGRLVA
jgi:plasmid replication initiation protein